MYKIILLFLFVISASCKGQTKIDEPEESISQPNVIADWQSPINSLDKDPYFVGSNDIMTSYGPQVITRNILQDKSGNLWFATWDGIIRYDPSAALKPGGKAFTNITNQAGLRRYRVFSILEDKKGNIWFGTIGAGVYRYDPSASLVPDEKSFVNFTTKDGLVDDRIGCIYEDKKGNIWFGTMGGVSCYDPSASLPTGGKPFTNFTTKEGLTNNDINSIIEDKNGIFWFGTRGEACFYDPSASLVPGGITFTKFKNKEGASFGNVRCIIEDKEGHIWLGGNGGLWRYNSDKDGGSFTNLMTDFVGYIYEDKKGNIWTSSQAPNDRRKWVLSRYDEKSLHDNPQASQILIKEDMFFGIIEDKEESIWVGTLNGVFRYDGKSFNYFK